MPPSGSATQPVVFHVAYTPLRTVSTSIPFFRALGNAGSGYGNGMTNDSLPQPAHTCHFLLADNGNSGNFGGNSNEAVARKNSYYFSILIGKTFEILVKR